MKNGVCCKCSSKSIYYCDDSKYADTCSIVLGSFSEIKLAHYVCTKCGYTETYVAKNTDLPRIVKKMKYIEPNE